jgi:hypothetical protein
MFTYDLATSVGQVRFYLGDNTEGQGVCPGGTNLTDEEITVVYSNAGQIGPALVRLARLISARWASAPKSFFADGLRLNRGDPAKRWLEIADEFDREFGVTASNGGYGTVKVVDLLREDIVDE